MPPFTKTSDLIRVCAGNCQRMTRPTSVLKTQAPDTITRVNGTHCGPCWKALTATDAPAVDPAVEAARKEALQAERQAAAHRAREAVEAQRAARQAKRLARPVSMGQSMVRI